MTLTDYYQDDLQNGDRAILLSQYKLWQRYLKNLSEEPTNTLHATSFCNNDIYPDEHKFVQILGTLPVSFKQNLKRI